MIRHGNERDSHLERDGFPCVWHDAAPFIVGGAAFAVHDAARLGREIARA